MFIRSCVIMKMIIRNGMSRVRKVFRIDRIMVVFVFCLKRYFWLLLNVIMLVV